MDGKESETQHPTANSNSKPREFPPELWISTFRNYYTALARRMQTIVCGSAIFYVCLGRAFPLKDLDFVLPSPMPLSLVSEACSEVFGVETNFRHRDGVNYDAGFEISFGHLIPVEIYTSRFLPNLSESVSSILSKEVIKKYRDGIEYLTISMEGYAVLEACRKNAIRLRGLERFSEVIHSIDWNRTLAIGSEIGLGHKVQAFISAMRRM